jgi:hypothetical protein
MDVFVYPGRFDDATVHGNVTRENSQATLQGVGVLEVADTAA